ncbi:glycoside hydrolase family 19 protein [Mesorhizobium sp. M0701]|uniref:glycoside hydrolase family 19 protein n=1 Tax=Mesorhizobium sp. M0701 TaxID=2956989 RepID=UPI0033370D74
MPINRNFLFDHARLNLFDGRMTQSQVNGITAILNTWEPALSTLDDRWLAYMLATAHHETGRTMQPVRETFAATDQGAIAILERAWAAKRLPWVTNPYWRPDSQGKSWLGRGLVQLTHKANYERIGRLLKVDLVTNPDLAMQPLVAANIMVRGMIDGIFTRYRLSQFFDGQKADWRNARRIINGTERADLVASYAKKYYAALSYTV